MQWRRKASKFGGAAFLVMLGITLGLDWIRSHMDAGPLYGAAIRMDAWALELTLVLAAALVLIVAAELCIVAWRLLHKRRPH